MSDFRDPAQGSVAGEQQGALERDWRHQEKASPEATVSASQQRFFEGASSMLELSNSLTAADHDLSSASEQNLRSLLKNVEKLRKASQVSPQEHLEPESPYLNRFLDRARAHYANQDFKACLEILHEGLKLAPGDPAVLALVEEVRRTSELRQAELEDSGLTDRIAQCKAEAIKLLEQGRYSDCVERFKVLSELEPANGDLRHYLEISQEQVANAKLSHLNGPGLVPGENQDTGIPALVSDTHAPGLVPPAEPLPQAVLIGPQRSDRPEIPTTQSVAPLPPRQRDSVAEAVPTLAAKPRGKMPGDPVAIQVNETRLLDLKAGRKETQPGIVEEETAGSAEDATQLGAKKLKIACLVGAGLVIGAVLGAWLALAPSKHSSLPEVASQPDGSQVGADPTQPPKPLAVSAEDDPQARAQKAFQQGKLLEANRFCENILQSEPDNKFALNLKQEIRTRFSKLGGQATADQRWGDACIAWNNVLKVFPNDHEASRQLKAARANLKDQEQLALASKLESEKKIEELYQQISLAISSGRYLPPSSGNALELIQTLENLSPDDVFGREKRDQILRDLTAVATRTLQAKDSARARTLVSQIQTYFPETAELKALQESLKTEEAHLAEVRNSWMQKAQAAMAAGRYVTPANDNVIAYCNQILSLEPQNAKALELKKASSVKASTQAKAWIQEGKYDDARAVYSSLLYLSQNENQSPLSSQELKAEVDKLTFSAHAVVHDHALGSCTGRLRFNGYQIAFVPSADSKDGFSVKTSEDVQVESDEKLKIHFKGKTYRFQTNGPKNLQESRARLSDIHHQLSALIGSQK
ncbi:MAG: hypothetical protein L0387_06380 [Acidobacteria bacterium]|nr:hypothetical protein [Acidobacteriota bacterium]MCI0719969.1 hypothetical protein [Acidobacteriota bacterium]